MRRLVGEDDLLLRDGGIADRGREGRDLLGPPAEDVPPEGSTVYFTEANCSLTCSTSGDPYDGSFALPVCGISPQRVGDRVYFRDEGHGEREQARQAIEDMVHIDRETRAWDQQDAAALVELFHSDMVWPWPPTERDHDPASWVFVMGRFERDRWTRGWQQLFATHRLVRNRREIRKIVVTNEADGCFAVVDVDTLWRDGQGGDNHWCGRACKVYTRMRDGEWKLIMHTGLLAY